MSSRLTFLSTPRSEKLSFLKKHIAFCARSSTSISRRCKWKSSAWTRTTRGRSTFRLSYLMHPRERARLALPKGDKAQGRKVCPPVAARRRSSHERGEPHRCWYRSRRHIWASERAVRCSLCHCT